MPSAGEEIDQDIREISQDPKYSKWFAYAPKRAKSRGGKKVESSTTTAPRKVLSKPEARKIQQRKGKEVPEEDNVLTDCSSDGDKVDQLETDDEDNSSSDVSAGE